MLKEKKKHVCGEGKSKVKKKKERIEETWI